MGTPSGRPIIGLVIQTLESNAPPQGGVTDIPIGFEPIVVPAPVARRGPLRVAMGVLSTTAGVVLAIVALLSIVVALSTHLAPNGQLGIFGHPVMSVISGSMAPEINTGDLVIDKKLTVEQAAHLHKGQVISFRADVGSHQIFTHRIVSVETGAHGTVGYVTKGDANDSRDEVIRPSTNVVGLYQAKIPAGGYILSALHRPLVLWLILAAPVLWLLSEPLWKWARQAEQPTTASATEKDEPRP
jgi:signal peptidase I